VFIDTAGRLQNKNGLMDELGKMIRVIQKVLPDAPHKTLLTLDATTGQNAVSQVEIFKKVCRVDGLVMTKLDGSSKGGVLVAVAGENPTPVYFIGVGEKTDDLDVFDAAAYAESLLGL
jgi:fused signal recognition particle receptor